MTLLNKPKDSRHLYSSPPASDLQAQTAACKKTVTSRAIPPEVENTKGVNTLCSTSCTRSQYSCYDGYPSFELVSMIALVSGCAFWNVYLSD